MNIPVTIDGKYGFAAPKNPIEDQGSSAGEIIIPKNVQDLIDSYAKTNSDIKVKILIKYIKNRGSYIIGKLSLFIQRRKFPIANYRSSYS